MPRAFISHSARDNDVVEGALLPTLRDNGIEYWYAPHGIEPGETFTSKITDELETCEVMFAVISANASGSKWMPDEIEIALAMERLIVPILTDDTPPYVVHPRLARLEHIDLRKGADQDVAYRKLVGILAPNRVPKPPPPRVPRSRPTARSVRVRLLAGLVAVAIGASLWITLTRPRDLIHPAELHEILETHYRDETEGAFTVVMDEVNWFLEGGLYEVDDLVPSNSTGAFESEWKFGRWDPYTAESVTEVLLSRLQENAQRRGADLTSAVVLAMAPEALGEHLSQQLFDRLRRRLANAYEAPLPQELDAFDAPSTDHSLSEWVLSKEKAEGGLAGVVKSELLRFSAHYPELVKLGLLVKFETPATDMPEDPAQRLAKSLRDFAREEIEEACRAGAERLASRICLQYAQATNGDASPCGPESQK